ncbi:substrate-binding domain-containing protein [Phytohabitans rumicis]|uniref:substrate-binding domain-containing protein n=1 Tax=Phytohabitans rumicis TaxID=1076125 RepID=UPI001FEB3182|nr:substrate-binding domain-containing protein [Phytohabitans rumicis]
MSGDLALGVLSPFLGGWYYGGLLRGIARSAAQEGATVVALQTLDAGTEQVEMRNPPDPGYPIAWEHVAGFIVIINAVSPRYLAAVQDAGKPIVIVSHEIPGLDCPVVLPDNRTGIREAVAHLVGHGHRRIAFAGYLGAKDVKQRYDAYREALVEHGLPVDPALLFPLDDNQMSSGEAAARAIVGAGMPATAVIAGTDANAIGLLETLAASGYRVPDDLAVVGFDDVRGASYTLPRLTTVNHPVDGIGRKAVATLVQRIRGEATPTGRIFVPTSLVVRESCGCPAATRPSGGWRRTAATTSASACTCRRPSASSTRSAWSCCAVTRRIRGGCGGWRVRPRGPAAWGCGATGTSPTRCWTWSARTSGTSRPSRGRPRCRSACSRRPI